MMNRTAPTLWGVATGLLLAVLAQAQREPQRIVVRCLAADGQPVAGALVHVFQQVRTPDGERLQGAGPFTTGDAGTARTVVATTLDGGRFDRWVHAVVPGRLVGGNRVLSSSRPPDPNTIDVRLLPSRSLHGQVHVPEGAQVEAIRVRVAALTRIDGDRLFGAVFPAQYSIAGLEDSLPRHFEAAVGADGTFALHDLPLTPLLHLVVQGPGLAQAQWSNALVPDRTVPETLEFALRPEGELAGCVRDPAGEPVRAARVLVQITSGSEQPVLWQFTGHCDADGRFRIGGLPTATFQVTVESAAGVLAPRRIEIVAGHAADVALPLEPGIEVAGTVVATDDATPVDGAWIAANDAAGFQPHLGRCRTDAAGRFVLRLPRCNAQIRVVSVPGGFEPPRAPLVATLQLGRRPPLPLRIVIDRSEHGPR
jgi:hypothetical protein